MVNSPLELRRIYCEYEMFAVVTVEVDCIGEANLA
jgi:hypothetical protein